MLLLLLLLQAVQCDEWKRDGNGQVEVYGPHTVVTSWLRSGGDLYIVFDSTLTPLHTTEHKLLARGVCPPYTVLHWHETTGVIHAGCGSEWNATLVYKADRYLLPIGNFTHIRFDSRTKRLYTLSEDGYLRGYNPQFDLVRMLLMGRGVGEFYVQAGDMYYTRNQSHYLYSRQGRITLLGPAPHNVIHTYHVNASPHQSLPIAFILTLAFTAITKWITIPVGINH